MEPLYQKYGVQINDPSAGLLAAAKDQKANIKDVISSISDLQKNVEGQIIQSNTQQAADMLKQRLAQEGLGILGKPIDTEVALRPFGNLVDKTAVDKILTAHTDNLKNSAINQFSAEADNILGQTSDPIAAREHVKKRLLSAGAPSVFADQEAVNYDLRKAAEIKNIDTRVQQTLDAGFANLIDAAKQGGYAGSKSKIPEIVSTLPAYKKAAATKFLNESFDNYATPNSYDTTQMNNAIAAYKEETANGLKAKLENRQQQNDQKFNVSDSISNSTGREGGTRSDRRDKTGGSLGPDLIDSKGVVNASVAVALGNKVNNFVEKMSSTSDSAVIKALHKDIADSVGDESVAGNILGQAFSYAYKGDRWHGNDLSKKDLEDMKRKATELAIAHNERSTGGSTSSSSSRSTSRGGNISFTNSDDIVKYISDRKKGELEFANNLMEAARNNKLGVTEYDGVKQLIDAYTANRDINISKPQTTQIMNLKNAALSTASTESSTNTVNPKITGATKDVVPNPFGNNKPNESVDAEIEKRAQRLVAKNREQQAKNKVTAPAQSTPATITTAVAEMTPEQRTAQAFAELAKQRANNAKKVEEAKKPKASHEGQVHVLDEKGKDYWVPANTDLKKFKYRLYNK